MFKFKNLIFLSLVAAFALSSCTMNKAVQHEVKETKHLHNGKYAHCSLCQAYTEQVQVADKEVQIAAIPIQQNKVISTKSVDLNRVAAYEPKKESRFDKKIGDAENLTSTPNQVPGVEKESKLHKLLVKSGIKKGLDDAPKVDPISLIAFIFSLIGILTLILQPIGFLFSLLGLIFGIIGLVRIKDNPGMYSGKGLATAAVVIGAVGVLLPLGLLFLLVFI